MTKFKKLIASLLCVFVVSGLMPTNVRAIEYGSDGITSYSEGVVLVNLDTHTIAYEKNSDDTFLPASITKIMTFIIASELATDVEATVTAPISVFNELVKYNASNAGFVVDEEIRILDLLYGLILPSGCDAAAILATTLTDNDPDEFIDLMNAKAVELGAVDTHFDDVHGLDNEHSYTTASDMAIITQYALENELFTKVATTQYYELPTTNLQAPRTLYHTNQVLYSGSSYYNSKVSGIKTGTTGDYEKNLITIAESDGTNYLLVLLAAPPLDSAGNAIEGTYSDTNKIYDWAFNNLFVHPLVSAAKEMKTVDIAYAKDSDTIKAVTKNELDVLLPSHVDVEKIESKITTNKDLEAPIEKGATIGKLEYIYDDEVIASTPLVAKATMEKSYFKFIWNYLKYILMGILILTVVGALTLVGLRIYNKNRRYSRISRPIKRKRSRY